MDSGVRLTDVYIYFRKDDPVTPEEQQQEIEENGWMGWLKVFIENTVERKITYKHAEWGLDYNTVVQWGLESRVDSSDLGGRKGINVVGIGCTPRRTCFVMYRTYSSYEYDRGYLLQLPEEAAKRAFQFALFMKGKPYDHPITQTFLIPTPPSNRQWFCIQFFVACLQQADLFIDLNPSEHTGDTILAYLNMFYEPKTPPFPGVVDATQAKKNRGLSNYG